MSDPITKRKATAWNPTIHKTITVKGPLGAFSLTFWKRLDVWGQGDWETGDKSSGRWREKTDSFDFWTGELKLEVPEFVKLAQDTSNQTAILSVEDANIHQQKEMWGM
jgi:ribosomal protein L6P/L9E